MTVIKKHFRRRTVALMVPVVVAVGAGSAIAATANDGAVIRACAAKSGKSLHLANADGKCGKGETVLAWNQTGPAGAAGAPGPVGPAGAAGPAGPAGAAGDGTNVVGGETLVGGQADGFLKIDGIAGESADPAHAGEIDVKAFGFGGKNSAGGGASGGGGAGKVAFSDVTFSKLYDASSPKLFQRLATGQHIPSVTFSFRRPGGANGAQFLTYKLSDVIVSSYDQGGSKERPLLERVELNFAKVEISYTPAGGAPITAGFDVKANKSL
ncbi:type VI secretion system tube protein Hcp [Solirubrobacter ginsenosidimutans]|uniref:Type VI secretion system tube protein Hcp n=1 Tax=Solirubrobacter ginsenosidimutans TaxID=490573 RepID=A0A9X3N033_9ACTN|nr:type VI secretion system tube protein Hcp [Solirubrobacter ginsenosidimutans]MDA0164598.1 type VI secretion system tube protein Hcp [Solirubrobacter ginsenosidimutans]